VTTDQIRRALTECGLSYDVVNDQPGSRVLMVSIPKGARFTYDVLERIAARFKTTDMRFVYQGEVLLSEDTLSEASTVHLTIGLPFTIGAEEVTQ
jgi:hypothetical protein